MHYSGYQRYKALIQSLLNYYVFAVNQLMY